MSLLAPSPVPRLQFFYPGTGNPLSGGVIETVQPGTTAIFNQSPAYPQPTFVDALGMTQNNNPATLDSSGSISMFLTGPTDIYVWDPNGNLVSYQKNVSALPGGATSTPQWVNQATTVTYISATQFSVPGNQTAAFTAGTRVQAAISGGNIYGTIVSSSSGGTPIVTTVTMIWDSTALNNSVTAIALGAASAGNPSSLPIQPVIGHTTAAYTFTITDIIPCGQIHEFTGSASTVGATLPAGSGLPNGANWTVKNVSTPILSIIGTIDGNSAVTLGQYGFKNIYWDGSAYGSH